MRTILFIRQLLMVTIFSLICDNSVSQVIVKEDPGQSRGSVLKMAVPVSLILGGLIMSDSNAERKLQNNIRNYTGNDYHFGIDDYSRYAPIAQLYVADLMGVKSKNHWFDQSKNLALSIVLTDFITFRLKKNIHKVRPNGGSEAESMPSGHTSFAFANASVLFHEFKDSNRLLAYSGYGFATITGVFRILNNAHWISDVMVSAGIGILVTEVIYLFDPIIRWNPFDKNEKITLGPQLKNNEYGIYFSVTF